MLFFNDFFIPLKSLGQKFIAITLSNDPSRLICNHQDITAYREILQNGKGNCWNNAVLACFQNWKTHQHRFKTKNGVKKTIFGYILVILLWIQQWWIDFPYPELIVHHRVVHRAWFSNNQLSWLLFHHRLLGIIPSGLLPLNCLNLSLSKSNENWGPITF